MADEIGSAGAESRTPRCRVIRTAENYVGKQGPSYAGGVSAESAGSQAIWLGLITIAPGGRTGAHYHAEHETALSMLSGVADMWYGDQLEHHEEVPAGNYIPSIHNLAIWAAWVRTDATGPGFGSHPGNLAA